MDIKRIIIYSLLAVAVLGIATQGFQDLSWGGLVTPMVVTLAYFTVIFLIAQPIKNNSIVDIGWGMGFVIGAWTTLFITPEPTVLSYLVVAFITIWGVRLSGRLFRRNVGKPEDFRYAQWRKEWGKNVVLIAFFRVFMIQAIINFVVGSTSYVLIRYNSFTMNGTLWIFVIIGLLISFTGLFFEIVGDEQLRRHIAKRTKNLLQTGLWSITRHPNYFGEILIWVGLYIAGLVVIDGSVSPLFYGVLILSPLIMSAVLIKISTPLLEEHMKRYDGWEAYANRVPMIFPWSKPKA